MDGAVLLFVLCSAHRHGEEFIGAVSCRCEERRQQEHRGKIA